MSVASQFLQSPCDNHWDVVIRILRYIKGTPSQGMLYEDRGLITTQKPHILDTNFHEFHTF